MLILPTANDNKDEQNASAVAPPLYSMKRIGNVVTYFHGSKDPASSNDKMPTRLTLPLAWLPERYDLISPDGGKITLARAQMGDVTICTEDGSNFVVRPVDDSKETSDHWIKYSHPSDGGIVLTSSLVPGCSLAPPDDKSHEYLFLGKSGDGQQVTLNDINASLTYRSMLDQNDTDTETPQQEYSMCWVKIEFDAESLKTTNLTSFSSYGCSFVLSTHLVDGDGDTDSSKAVFLPYSATVPDGTQRFFQLNEGKVIATARSMTLPSFWEAAKAFGQEFVQKKGTKFEPKKTQKPTA